MTTLEPIAHNKDPGTSHLAAAHMEESGKLPAQQALVYRMVCETPGNTCAEIAKLNEDELRRHDFDVLMLVRRRVTDLVRKGFCEYGARRKCAVRGRSANEVWLKGFWNEG